LRVTEFVQPMPGQLPPELPEVPVAWVGYRRADVDAHMATLAIQLEAERSRADAAEQALADARSAIQATHHRPPPGHGELARRVAIVHRQAGAAADAIIAEAVQAARRLLLGGEVAASQIMRRARYDAFDLELAARDALDGAAVDRKRIEAEARREGDRMHALAVSEGRLIVGEARDAAEMVLDEAAGRRRAVEDEIAELEELRRELVTQAARFQARLDRLLPDLPATEPEAAEPAPPPRPTRNGLAAAKA
jgi:hypothetical protein